MILHFGNVVSSDTDKNELLNKNWNPLFEKALTKICKLKANEMYDWKHHIAIG